ncbi:MAG: hypothetical protein PHP11_02985 [Erysipelotrichaceae bacterium]|nr:hypothetical protein [Erysipelotrichaceae bacterium]MDD3924048.1 hypothetical protein [Erysipelotrichaceae bacterium]MDD4643092.1 hypothetical protein [Erysipelotrichaceae bacterium]
MDFNKSELKYLKRAIANAKSIKAIEYENIIFEGNDHLKSYKDKLKKYDRLINIIALVVWILIITLIDLQSQLIELAILIVFMIISYMIHEYLVTMILPDNSFDHLKKL